MEHIEILHEILRNSQLTLVCDHATIAVCKDNRLSKLEPLYVQLELGSPPIRRCAFQLLRRFGRLFLSFLSLGS